MNIDVLNISNALQRLSQITERFEGGEVSIGFFDDGERYPVTKDNPEALSVPLVAWKNEFGTNGPPRPFFRRMIKDSSGDWPKDFARFLAINKDSKKTLELMGSVVKGQLVRSIWELTSPPLAYETVLKKGHSKPLIETHRMVNSVTYRVEMNELESD